MTPITFLHMPKTAGTSIIASMQERFGEDGCYVHGQTAPWSKFDTLAPSLAKYSAIAGHLTIEQLDRVPGDKRIFTVIRPPVDRILSWYEFLLRARRATLHPWTKDGDIHTFIERCCENRRGGTRMHPNAHEMFNGMCRRLHPDGTAEAALEVIHDRRILVLDQVRLADDLPKLGEWIDLPALPRLNVTAEKPVYMPSVLARISELNTEDEKLYAALA